MEFYTCDSESYVVCCNLAFLMLDLATNELHLMDARNAAMQSDVVIVAVGERFENSGEAKSRADINIHPNHQLLVKELKKTG